MSNKEKVAVYNQLSTLYAQLEVLNSYNTVSSGLFVCSLETNVDEVEYQPIIALDREMVTALVEGLEWKIADLERMLNIYIYNEQ